ncbi:MAG: FMN-binding protein [Treponema sp.]|nr:FMN-binding protein [Treponema sp.]
MKKIVLFLIIGLLIIGCSTAYKSITAQMPDLSQINDGVYRGFYDVSGTPVKVTLDVILQNNRITNIEIINHFRSPIGKKAENIIWQIIEKQNLDIDAVSGATASSKAILKAVENAFQ